MGKLETTAAQGLLPTCRAPRQAVVGDARVDGQVVAPQTEPGGVTAPAAELRLAASRATYVSARESLSRQAMSFGQLARRSIGGMISQLTRELQSVPNDVLPHEPSLRTLRKLVLAARTELDLFPHAFASNGRWEEYRRVRASLDALYSHIGGFKDLFSTPSSWWWRRRIR